MSPGASLAERTKIINQGVALSSRMSGWITVQSHFAPNTISLRQSLTDKASTESDDSTPWLIPLCLPSDGPEAMRCYEHRARRYEFKYGLAEAETSLKDLRNALVFDAHMKASKEKYSSGVQQTTRSVQILKDMSDRVRREADRYRRVRKRLVLLWEGLKDAEDMEEHGDWMSVLEVLEDDHVRGPTSLDDERLGDGSKILSWIWTVPGTGADVRTVAFTGKLVDTCIPLYSNSL